MVPNVTLVMKVAGRRKTLNYRKVPFKSWSELKARLKFTPQTLIEAIGDGDVEAGMAVLWLERRQRERGLSYNRFLREFDEEKEPELDVIGMKIDDRWIIEPDEEGDGSAADEDDEDEEEDPTGGSS